MEAIITGGRMYASERPQGCKSHQAHQTAFRCWGSGSGSCDRQLVVGIRRRFHNHAPQQLATLLAFHQQVADELRGKLLGGAAEEGVGKVVRGRGGYGSGFGGWGWWLLGGSHAKATRPRNIKTYLNYAAACVP